MRQLPFGVWWGPYASTSSARRCLRRPPSPRHPSPYRPTPRALLPVLRSRVGRPGPADALAWRVHRVPELRSGFLALVIHQHFLVTGVFALDGARLPDWAARAGRLPWCG